MSQFITYPLNGAWYWRGEGVYAQYCSEDAFNLPSEAEADAQNVLASIDLPELETPDYVRLLIAADFRINGNVAALNLDSKQACIVDSADAYNFFVDLLNLDQALADRYNEDFVIQSGMTGTDWAAWLRNYESLDSDRPVWLTCDSDDGNGIQAINIVSLQSVDVPDNQVAHFVPDCYGWDSEQFDDSYSIATRMSAENWQLWLKRYKSDGQLAETGALLSN